MRIKFQNGSEILFAGLDDVEKLKSIYDITGIWIEEASELLEGDFNQLDIRLRTVTPYYLQIILSFNPISGCPCRCSRVSASVQWPCAAPPGP
mgnify:CR=1 FL=1